MIALDKSKEALDQANQSSERTRNTLDASMSVWIQTQLELKTIALESNMVALDQTNMALDVK